VPAAAAILVHRSKMSVYIHVTSIPIFLLIILHALQRLCSGWENLCFKLILTKYQCDLIPFLAKLSLSCSVGVGNSVFHAMNAICEEQGFMSCIEVSKVLFVQV
jgi:hypothetical protein